MNSENLGIKKYGVWIALIVIISLIALYVVRGEFSYATNLQFEGVVDDIAWVSENHQLPEFSILDKSENKILISHFTIALNKSDIKIGDKISKKYGSKFCIINSKKIEFSRY